MLRKALRADLARPNARIDEPEGAAGVHLVNLAAYIDNRRNAAVKECCQLTRRQEYEFGMTTPGQELSSNSLVPYFVRPIIKTK